MLTFLRKNIGYASPVRIAWHRLRGVAAAVVFGFPGKRLVAIGVTGTNGKTTTTHMIEHILRSAGKKVAMVSTVQLSLNGEVTPNETKKTTLSPFATQRFLRRCVQDKVEYVVLEASSHALHQSRLWGIPFAIAVLSNITHEHLDYHGDLKEYAKAKQTLFQNAERTSRKKDPTLAPHRNAFVINAATRFFSQFMQGGGPDKIVYGLGQGDLQAREIRCDQDGCRFLMRHYRQQAEVKLPLLGEYNVENALAAAGAALACQVPLERIAAALQDFRSVPGRMERIPSPKGFEVIVDFALTPDALDRLYQGLRSLDGGRLIGVIGSCGDRDRKKRPDMGRVVAEHCDITIVTDEEPYSEDPKAIMEAVLEGAKNVKTLGKDLFLIEDRYQAIEFAIRHAKPGDRVVVTGMGSFTTRTMNDGPMEWDERNIVRKIIAEQS